MTPAPEAGNGPAPVSNPVRIAVYVVAVVFLLVGILGFIPGVTSDYDTMEFAGPDSEAMLFGVVGLLMARSVRMARLYLIGGGLIYLLLFIYGLVVERGSDADVVPLNDADNWLHLGLAAGMILLGLLPTSRVRGGSRKTG